MASSASLLAVHDGLLSTKHVLKAASRPGLHKGFLVLPAARPALKCSVQRGSQYACSSSGRPALPSWVAAGAPTKASLFTQRMDAPPSPGFDTIASALEDLAAGKFVVVLDDEDRENEGDLIAAADKMTTEAMAFMVEHTSGVICIAMEGADCDRLALPLMVDSRENNESMYTAFTVTVDLRAGTSTGISASDRAATVRALADPNAAVADFRRPGHIFPLRYRPGGVVVRPGHTEAAVDLARAAGSYPAGVLCEIVDRRNGSMARTPQLLEFAREHGLRCITIADLVRYRLQHEALIAPAAQPAQIATRHGPFTAHAFASHIDGGEHVALVYGGAAGDGAGSAAGSGAGTGGVLVRLQLQSTLADVFGSQHCGAESSLDAALRSVASAGSGVVLYVHSHAAGQPKGLAAELEAYARSQGECSTTSSGSSSGSSSGPAVWDMRDDAAAAQMLKQLGITSVRLLGGEAAQAQRLRALGVDVLGCVPLSLGQGASLGQQLDALQSNGRLAAVGS